jgi:hypothetical protein
MASRDAFREVFPFTLHRTAQAGFGHPEVREKKTTGELKLG